MKTRHYLQTLILITTIFGLLLSIANAGQAGTAKKKEFEFHGKVEQVDVKANSLKVKNEKVAGWMDTMSMSYTVDKPDVLKSLKVGDEITAKVYEGDFKVLYDVKVAPAKPAETPKKK